MKTSLLLLLSSVLSLTAIDSQEDLSFYADVMVTASSAEHRDHAAKQFEQLFASELEKEKSFKNGFEELEWISIQYPEDGSFRTLTWQVEKAEGGYHYGGYLQTKDGRLYAVAGEKGIANSNIDRSINWKDWQGGLVYKILTIPSVKESQYYLLSYHQSGQYTKVKVLEPILITNESIELGATDIFTLTEGSQKAKRIVLEYSADSQASINYNPISGQVVMDHLIPMNGRIPGQGPTMVPDGSYTAYQLEKDGTWKYIDKLYNETFDSPPNNGKSTSGRDIFGKVKN